MKIAVMGAGALGGYFGGRLAAGGHDVTLIARGAHLAAIRADGLRIFSPKGDLHVPGIAATDDPGSVGPVDVVLFMVKNYDVDEAARAIAPIVVGDTMVVTCQNGVSAPDRVGAVIGAKHVVPGVVRMPADIPEPGVIRHGAAVDRFSFGEVGGAVSARCAAFRDALIEAGAEGVIPDDIVHDLWAKFIVQSALASITALTRLDIGPLRENPASRDLFLGAIAEANRVGRAAVPDLPEGIIEKSWEFLNGFPRTMHASMLDDLLKGRRIELDYLGGEVVRLGEKHGIPTPIHSVLTAALTPFQEGTPD